MKWKVSHTRRAAAWALMTLLGAALVQAAGPPVAPAAAKSQMLTNAAVVAVDAEAGTLTVGGGAIGKPQTFEVAEDARPDLRALEPGDEVVLAIGAAAGSAATITRVERSSANTASTPSKARREAPPAAPEAGATPPVSTPAASPSTPRPSPSPTAEAGESLPTDTVGPMRDPRVNALFDPRGNPHRDPRKVPGLTQPVASPSPTE